MFNEDLEREAARLLARDAGLAVGSLARNRLAGHAHSSPTRGSGLLGALLEAAGASHEA